MKKMKLWGLVITVLIVVGVLTLYGRDLLGLYRLQSYITQSAEAYEVDRGAWPHLTDVCTGCHGVNGNSRNERYPSLAGLPAEYLASQLRHFASGQRHSPNMGPLAMTLSEQEITQLAEYFARQSATGGSSSALDPGMKSKGEKLVVSAGCVSCHGEHLVGVAGFPRLAGQGYGYLHKQLDAFATGQRSDPSGAMNAVAAALAPDEREIVAKYLASLSVEKTSN